MEGKPAKVVISASDGRIEFEGSEEFVEKQLATFGDLIKESMQRAVKKPAAGGGAKDQGKSRGSDQLEGGGDLSQYENVFAQGDDGKIQISKDMPGTSTAEKMVNAARLVALGNTLLKKPTTAFEEIRDVCKAHGCLDISNFSARIKEVKSDFVFGGGPRSQTLTLTKPGRAVAEKLAAELNK
jgi:hypothetical protein